MSRFTKILTSLGLPSPQVSYAEWEENATLKTAIGAGNASLLGTTPIAQLEVDMWLTFSLKDITDAQLSALNEILLFKTFLVGNSISLADYSVYVAVANRNLTTVVNVLRWFKHVQSIAKPVDGIDKIVSASAPLFISFPLFDGEVVKAVETAVAVPAVAASAAAATPAPAAVPEGGKKKEGKPKAAAPAAAAEEPASASLDPTKLDIRCGLVTKCWNHPDSDKLLCEEIDLGAGDVRQIASGIRAFYSAEQLVGKKVVVLSNLKERSIGGFKSQVCISIIHIL